MCVTFLFSKQHERPNQCEPWFVGRGRRGRGRVAGGGESAGVSLNSLPGEGCWSLPDAVPTILWYSTLFRSCYCAETKPNRELRPPQAPPFDLHPVKLKEFFIYISNLNMNDNTIHCPVRALSRENQTKVPPFDLHPPKYTV